MDNRAVLFLAGIILIRCPLLGSQSGATLKTKPSLARKPDIKQANRLHLRVIPRRNMLDSSNKGDCLLPPFRAKNGWNEACGQIPRTNWLRRRDSFDAWFQSQFERADNADSFSDGGMADLSFRLADNPASRLGIGRWIHV